MGADCYDSELRINQDYIGIFYSFWSVRGSVHKIYACFLKK
jgi:hypothetical protein